MIVNIGIATKGRSSILAETLRVIQSQSRLPDRVIVCPTERNDLPEDLPSVQSDRVVVVNAPLGSCSQRNRIIEASKEADIIVFIDDDFFLAADYLARVEQIFSEHPNVVATTGHVLADGICGPGLTPEQGRTILASASKSETGHAKHTYSTYGCNMAFRIQTILESGIRFDERLPMYGWQEDVDFSRQIAQFGDVILHTGLQGVHLGHKSGRTTGLRLGYSQIANPVYLMKKGTLSHIFAIELMLRNIAMNTFKFAFPEPYVDRRGRFRGNAFALWHLLLGKLNPENVLKL